MTINAVSNKIGVINSNFKSSNLNFKGTQEKTETQLNDAKMSKGLAQAIKSMALAGMLVAGVAGCGGKTEVIHERTQDDVKTELKTSQFGTEAQKQLLEKEFGNLISSTNAALDAKGMTVEQKQAFLQKRFNVVIDQTSDILFNGSQENIDKNVKLAKKEAEKVAKIMTNDKLSTTEKAKEFTKLFKNDNYGLTWLLIIGLAVAQIGASTRKTWADLGSFMLASAIILNSQASIKANANRADDILTGVSSRIEKRLEAKDAQNNNQDWKTTVQKLIQDGKKKADEIFSASKPEQK